MRTLDARPAEAFRHTDDRGEPLDVAHARRREQRRCEGVWVLPVTLSADLSVQPDEDWLLLAQRMPEGALLRHGDVWECALRLGQTRPWPPQRTALVLMLWPHVARTFRTPGPAPGAALAPALAGAPAGLAVQAGGPAGEPDPWAGAPSGEVLDAILAALDEQGRPEGSLSSGLIRLAAA